MHSLHENVASIGTPDGTAARDDTIGSDIALQVEADLTRRAMEGDEACVKPVQADAVRPTDPTTC